MHVAAGVHPDVQGQRIFGFAHPYTWDQALDIMRKVDPQRKLRENFDSAVGNVTVEPRAKAEKLLRDLGRPGWMSFEETVLANIKDA